jgi:hypothetical protein
VSDRKLAVDSNSDGTVDYYTANVVTANDYYPYGMEINDRTFSQPNSNYRYSINGQEKSDEIAPNLTTAKFWEYDSRISKRWDTDPKPNAGVSPYATFSCNPISQIDALGDTVGTTIDKIAYSFYKKDGKYNLYDNQGKAYSGNNKWAKKLVNSLTELSNVSDDVIKQRFNDVTTSKFRHNIVEGQVGSVGANGLVASDDKSSLISWDGTTTQVPDGMGGQRLDYATEKLVHELLGHGWQAQHGFGAKDFNEGGINPNKHPDAFYNPNDGSLTNLSSSPIIGITDAEIDASSVQNRYLGYYGRRPLEFYPVPQVKANTQSTDHIDIIKMQQRPEVKALYFLFPVGSNQFLTPRKN